MKTTWMIALAALALGSACSKDNSNYCANAPDHNCAEQSDAPVGSDGPTGCQQQSDCTTTALPVCDLAMHACVACDSTHTATCPSATPICDTTGETCHTCVTHSECGSPGACLPDGTCGSDTNVAWVAAGGSDSLACTHDAPCATITHALTLSKPYIRVSGAIVDMPSIGTNVTILGEAGAKVSPSTAGPVVTIHGTPTVEIHDLRISGGMTTTGIGLYVASIDAPTVKLRHMVIDTNGGLGISVGAGVLNMDRCVLSGNTNGGASVAATYAITNSIFVANGSGTSTVGGLQLTPDSSSTFKFNTIADNGSGTGTASSRGINCVAPATLADTILSGVGNTAAANCTFTYSLFDTGSPAGTNKVGTPGYVNTNAGDPTAADYYRIGSGSPAVDSADPTSTIVDDIDMHVRPVNNVSDIGASEYKP